MTEMNKAYGRVADFIEAGCSYPHDEPGCDGDIILQKKSRKRRTS
jgi:hypothetical protein